MQLFRQKLVLPEINIDGITGYLSEIGDIDKMSNDIISLIENPKKLEI